MSELGRVTEEEQAIIANARQRGRECLLRLGELELQCSRLRQQQLLLEQQILGLRDKEGAALQEKMNVCQELETIEKDARQIIDQLNQRLGLGPGLQWMVMEDGTIQQMEK